MNCAVHASQRKVGVCCHQRPLRTGKLCWDMPQLLFQGQKDLRDSGLNFSHCLGGRGIGESAGLWQYPLLKNYFFIFIALSKNLHLYETLLSFNLHVALAGRKSSIVFDCSVIEILPCSAESDNLWTFKLSI